MKRLSALPLLLLFCLSASLCLAGERPAEWARPVTLPHVENLFRVTPDFYRAAQPNKEAMASFVDFGIKTVVNLRHNHNDADEAAGMPLVLRRVRINTWSIEETEVVEAVALILSSPKPVLLHCQHGADRTGLITAVYRVTQQGWSKAEAKREMIEGGYGYHKIWTNIPEWLDKMNTQRVTERIRARSAELAQSGGN